MAGSVSRLFSQCLLRSSTLRSTFCLESDRGRGLWSSLLPATRTANGPSFLSFSTQKKGDDDGLCGPLYIKKSKKKSKSKKKYLAQNGLASNPERIHIAPSAPHDYTRIGLARKQRNMETNKPGSKMSFLSALGSTLCKQQHEDSRAMKNKESVSPSPNFTMVEEHPPEQGMGSSDGRKSFRNTLDPDLAPSAWKPEDNLWTKLRFPEKTPSMVKEEDANITRGLKVDGDRTRKSSSSTGYEHILYDDKRYQNDTASHDSGWRQANFSYDDAGNTKKSLIESRMYPINGNLHSGDDVTDDVNYESTSDTTTKNKLSNGFILVDEVSDQSMMANDNTRDRKTSMHYTNVDGLIKAMRTSQWGKQAQMAVCDHFRNKSPYSGMAKDEPSPVNENIDMFNLKLGDENVMLTKDQMDKYISGSKLQSMTTSYTVSSSPSTNSTRSNVPNNTATLPNQVCVQKLMPDLKKDQVRSTMSHLNDSRVERENQSTFEPMLVVQPSEIINRRKSFQQDSSTIDDITKEYLNLGSINIDRSEKSSDTDPQSQRRVNEKRAMKEDNFNSSRNRIQKLQSDDKPLNCRDQNQSHYGNNIYYTNSKLSNKTNKKKTKKKKGRDLSNTRYPIGFSVEKPRHPERGEATYQTKSMKGTKSTMSKTELELRKELKEQWKDEFRENFLQMQRDRLIRMSVTPISRPTLLTTSSIGRSSGTNKTSKPGSNDFIDIVKREDNRIKNRNDTSKWKGRTPKDKTKKPTDPYEGWTKFRDDMYHQQITEKHRMGTENASRSPNSFYAMSKDVPSPSYQTSSLDCQAMEVDPQVRDISTHRIDQYDPHPQPKLPFSNIDGNVNGLLDKIFQFNPKVEILTDKNLQLQRGAITPLDDIGNTSNNSPLQRNSGIKHGERGQKHPPMFDLDGLMTMKLEPVTEAEEKRKLECKENAIGPPEKAKLSKTTVSTEEIPLSEPLTPYLTSSVKSKHRKRTQEMPLQRYLSALERYYENSRLKKEEKKMNKKKNRRSKTSASRTMT